MDSRRDHNFDPFNPSPEHQAILDSVSGFDRDGVDYSDPATIAALLGGPVPPTMKPSALQKRAQAMSKDIFESHAELQGIRKLQRHEATIQKRWLKKTRPQKLKVLVEAWPNMAAVHRPDFQAFRKESESARHAGTSFRDHFVWPYINQEDLAKPKTLLLLLSSRGRHPPCAFAAADAEAMHLGTVLRAITPVFLNEYVLILNGAETVQEYGRLVAWDDHPDAFDWMHLRKQFLPGEGLLVLEAQQRLLQFLVKCCRLILHDIPEKTMTDESLPILPEPQLKTEAEIEGFESLAVMAAEAPYRVPAHLDLGRVTSLLEARTSAAEDHLWALREDPSYFAERLLEVRDHRQEMLPDLLKNTHPVNTEARRGTLWARVIGNILVESYLQLEFFTELKRQARALQELHFKYEGILSPLKDLPDDYLKALLKFRHYLQQAAKGPLGQLKSVVVASPPMRGFFVRQPPPDSTTSMISVMSRPGVKLSNLEGQVLWLLRTLWEDGQSLFLAGLTNVVDELERLLNSEPEVKNLIDAYVASIIGDLSIISQCLRQLELYQPWANGFEAQLVDHEDGLKESYAAESTKWAALLRGFRDRDLVGSQILALGEPTGGRFEYPVGKRRTQQNVEKMRQAEANLDAFWASVDHMTQKKGGNIEGTAVKRLLSLGREIQRTPEWIEPPKAEPSTADHKTTTHEDVDDMLVRPLSTLYFGKSESSGAVLPLPSRKDKVKTRGMASTKESQEVDVGAGAEQNTADPQPTFQVDARAFRVFRTLFFNPRVTSTPGEVRWADFLHALASTGFVAEKLYGSVWQFRPTKLDVEKNIQFHEPHPRGKIPFTTARRLGRRLNRTYGWFGNMFELRK